MKNWFAWIERRPWLLSLGLFIVWALGWAAMIAVGRAIFALLLPVVTPVQLAVWGLSCFALTAIAYASLSAGIAGLRRRRRPRRPVRKPSLPVEAGQVLGFYLQGAEDEPFLTGEVTRVVRGIVCPKDFGVELRSLRSGDDESFSLRCICGVWWLSRGGYSLKGRVEHVPSLVPHR